MTRGRMTGRGMWTALCAAATMTLGSCVSQQQYDEAVLSAEGFQERMFELEDQLRLAQNETGSLRRQLDAAEIGIEDAGYDEIDERLENLNKIMAEMGSQPGDATKFQVDGGFVYRLSNSILFGLGSAEVSDEGRRVLMEVARDINSQGAERIEVRGHTDNTPIKKAATLARYPHGNLQLSSERAIGVASLLIQEGSVPASSVVVMGFGQWDTVVPNDSAANKAKNRRVDIFVPTQGQ